MCIFLLPPPPPPYNYCGLVMMQIANFSMFLKKKKYFVLISSD